MGEREAGINKLSSFCALKLSHCGVKWVKEKLDRRQGKSELKKGQLWPSS